MIMAKDSNNNYVKIEDIKQQNSGENLENYRIYGNTVGGESVGDRTGNLFANLWKKGYIRADNGREEQIDGFICSGFFPVEYGQTYSISRNIRAGYNNIRGYKDDESFIGAGTDVCDVTNPFPSGASIFGAFTVTNENVAFIRFNDSANDLDMKYMIVDGTYTEQTMPSYEPYGYRVPVMVTNGMDAQTTNVYLPEQIKMVGDEAEYVDYQEQKLHRVRKNLLPNTATSKTMNSVTFTVNSDGSVTCNGTANGGTALFWIPAITLPAGQYSINGCPVGGDENTTYKILILANNEWLTNDKGSGANFTLTETSTVSLRIAIYNGYTCNNLTFYPMIRKADITDDTYEPYIENVDLDVTLPALPTLSGTNTLSVGTNTKPSKVWGKLSDPRDILYVKDNLGNILFSKYHEIEGEPPLIYKAKKAGTLKNYRIYGQTSRNLFNETIYNKNVEDNMIIYVPIYVGNIDYVTCSTTCPKTITGDLDSANSRYIFILSGSVNTGAKNDVNGVSNGAPRTIQPSNGYVTIAYRKIENHNVRPWEYQTMLNEGPTVLPYEPYGESVGDLVTSGEHAGEYKVPVTVEGKNLFDMKKFAETAAPTNATVNYSENSLIFTPKVVDAYVNWVYSQGNVPDELRPSCIDVLPSTTYTISMSSTPACYISWLDNFYNAVSQFTGIPINQPSYTFTTPSNCTKLLIRLGKRVNNIGDKFTISNIMLNEGSTALPYEPYHAPVTTPIYLPDQIRKVGDKAEYIDYGEQKFVKKFYKITLNFDDMNNDETFPGWSGGTAVVEYCNKIRSLAINTPDGYTPFQYSSISNFKANFNVRSNRSILYLGTSFNIGHTQSELKEIYAGRSITFILKIPDTDLDVTLPALPTLSGTNTLSVGTEVQPSKVYIKGKLKRIIYGWHVNPDISDSSNAVTYLKDAIGMTPASMGSTTFDYGSWENAFFMPKPCMLKSNGKVDYYLDPNDYTKKLDGTASDISNPNYDGNAMMQWPKIWFKYVKGVKEGQGYFYVANYKADGNFHCWCNYDSENNEIDHFYTAIYNGTSFANYSSSRTYVINDFAIYDNKLYKCNTDIATAESFDNTKWDLVSNTAPVINKMRSLSGVRLTNNNGNAQTDTTTETTRATANNTTSAAEWYIETFSDRLLINGLLVLMGKSLNTQAVFGRGLDTGKQSAKEAYVTGTLNNKGLFWGVTENGNSGVKVFGMENFWGCVWHRTAGLITNNHAVKLKLTYGTKDGSTVIGYNQTGNGYIDNGTASYSNGYVQKMSYNKYGFMPAVVTGGSQSTYYADYHYQNANYTGAIYALFGGRSADGLDAGSFSLSLNTAPGSAHWSISASLSCKPLLN